MAKQRPFILKNDSDLAQRGTMPKQTNSQKTCQNVPKKPEPSKKKNESRFKIAYPGNID